jgi:flagellar basal-body rod protein FlgF
MDTALYVGLSHQMALRRQMDLIANNLANMSTTGYRRENVVFRNVLENTENTGTPGASKVNFVLDFGVQRDQTPGAFVATANPLDIALDGPGYFSVQMANGETAYTRNGRFQLSTDRHLTLFNGAKVLDTRGQPIQIPDGEYNIKIAADGTVQTNTGDKAQVGVVRFANELDLKRVGDNMYAGPGAQAVPDLEIQVQPGMLEGSNIQPIHEMTEMIDVLRTYQSTTRMLDRYDDMRRKGLERLGKMQ